MFDKLQHVLRMPVLKMSSRIGTGQGCNYRNFTLLHSHSNSVTQSHRNFKFMVKNQEKTRQFSIEVQRPIVYSFDVSPPCRAVLLTAEAIDLDLDIREVSLWKKEHLKDEYININPQHTIPVLNDDGFILGDSHAIMCYLSGKYGKNDALYPKDLQKRAVIDQRLYFDTGVLFATLRSITNPILIHGQFEIPKERLEPLREAYNFLDKFLKGKKWLAASDSYTLADISCVSTVSSLTAFLPIDDYPNIIAWLEACENELPGYKVANVPGNQRFHATLKKLLNKQQ